MQSVSRGELFSCCSRESVDLASQGAKKPALPGVAGVSAGLS